VYAIDSSSRLRTDTVGRRLILPPRCSSNVASPIDRARTPDAVPIAARTLSCWTRLEQAIDSVRESSSLVAIDRMSAPLHAIARITSATAAAPSAAMSTISAKPDDGWRVFSSFMTCPSGICRLSYNTRSRDGGGGASVIRSA
jgi:hypothetical protein